MATILVIDDERLLCDLLQNSLREHGHEVFTAYNGHEGVASFRQRRPRFTLLDLNLPDINGLEVLKEIRQIDPQSAVIILTGCATDQLEEQARDLGITDFLIKDLALDVLIGTVQRAMQEPGTPAGSPTTPADTVGLPSTLQEEHSILIVDDDSQMRDMLTQYLSKHGYRVLSAQDGPAAVSLAEREQPHLIVLDINMPGMNGVEVLRKLRAKHYDGGVMMLTGVQDEKLLKEALNLGSLDIVGKPADLEHIRLAIEVSLILSKR
ncbi:MAG TPA: response regulator [Nitrospirales bacterium]|nr:response regulator [Nitrospirales bacterium]